jgi:hypothetical protein
LYTGDFSSGEIERSSEPCGGEKPVGLEVIATIFSADNLRMIQSAMDCLLIGKLCANTELLGRAIVQQEV